MASPTFPFLLPLLFPISCLLLAGSPLCARASVVSCPSSCLRNLRQCPDGDDVSCRAKMASDCLAVCGGMRDMEDDTKPSGLKPAETTTPDSKDTGKDNNNNNNNNNRRRSNNHQHQSNNPLKLKLDNNNSKSSPRIQRSKRHTSYPFRNQRQGSSLPQIERDLIQYITQQLIKDDQEKIYSLKQDMKKLHLEENMSSEDLQQPIKIVERGSWNKRQPITTSRRGSWNKRQPIEIAERGSWNKRQPMKISERGSWNKRFLDDDDDVVDGWSKFQPIRISERGSWNKRFLDDNDDWSKFQPIRIQERGSWNKRGSWN